MVALKSAEIEAFIARPDPQRPVVLLYGPDEGLVRERADAIIRASVDDPRDPFSLTRLEGDALAADPMRLADEAATMPLLGGRRAVSVRAGSANIAPAVEAVLAAPLADCRVVIEAGDLRRNAPLRTLCEGARNAAAIACYPDQEGDLVRLVNAEMRAAGLTIAPEARTALVSLLGGDRRTTRGEIRKLVLYAQGRRRVELDDVLAVAADASALAVDAVIDALLAGQAAEFERQFAKSRAAGVSADRILAMAIRHAVMMHRIALDAARGLPPAQALARMPQIHFLRRPKIEAALAAWPPARLERAMRELTAAMLKARRQPALADAIARDALIAIARPSPRHRA